MNILEYLETYLVHLELRLEPRESVRDQTPKHPRQPIHTIPRPNPQSLLPPPPPHLRNRQETRPDARLKRPQHEPRNEQTAKIPRPRHARQRQPPPQHHGARELPYGQLDERQRDGQLEHELGEEDDAPQPGELVAVQARVLDQAEDGGVGERRLVEGVEEVDDEHEREERDVDAAQDAGVGLGGYAESVGGIVAELDEHRGGGVAVGRRACTGSSAACADGVGRGAERSIVVVVVVSVVLAEGLVVG